MGRAWPVRAVRILKLEAPSIVAGLSLIFLALVTSYFQRRALLPLIVDSIEEGSFLRVAVFILANNLLTGLMFFLVTSYVFGISIPVSLKRCATIWTKDCILPGAMSERRRLVAMVSFLILYVGFTVKTAQVLGLETLRDLARSLAYAYTRTYGLLETLGYALLALSPSTNRGSLALALVGVLCIILGALVEAHFLTV